MEPDEPIIGDYRKDGDKEYIYTQNGWKRYSSREELLKLASAIAETEAMCADDFIVDFLSDVRTLARRDEEDLAINLLELCDEYEKQWRGQLD